MTDTRSRTGASAVDAEAPVRIVSVGAGPGAIMVLERLLASHRRDTPELPLEITLVDPHPAGGGRIWRRDQSPLLKLNSMLEDVAFFTDDSCEIAGPIEPGPSLADWVRLVRDGEIAPPAWSDALLAAEIATVDGRSFPTRRLNNAYLSWAYDEVLRRAAPAVRVEWVRGLVERVARTGTTRHAVILASGRELPADIVLHSVGHNGSQPSSDALRMGEFADRHGLAYVAPAFTADVDLDWIPAGEPVIVRGMGLAAVDLTVLLTEGRGGRFARAPEGLRYIPSGREPELHLGSRRGVPYRSKITSVPVGDPVQLEYLGPAFHETVSSRTTPLDFEQDIWPLLHAEMLTGYYRELFTGHPDRVTGDWMAFSSELRALLPGLPGLAGSDPAGRSPASIDTAALEALIAAHVPHLDDRFTLDAFDRPLGTPGPTPAGTSRIPEATVQSRVSAHIEQDLRQRTRPEHSATQALFLTVLYAYMSIAEVPAERWNAVSRARALPRRWHGFFSYLASGPPGHRLEELLALADAGIVRFLGADIEITRDEGGGRFVATGSAETAIGTAHASVSAETLIDAWLPEAQAARSDNPLLRQLVATGQVAELAVADEQFAGTTGQVVVQPGGVLPDSAGQFAAGPFTSMPGAGAFTRPGMNSLPFRLHDRVARAMLAEAQAVHRASQPAVAIGTVAG